VLASVSGLASVSELELALVLESVSP
jgi:hypothetical protein